MGALARRNPDFGPQLYQRIAVEVFSIRHGFRQPAEAGQIDSVGRSKVQACSLWPTRSDCIAQRSQQPPGDGN